MRVGFHRIIAIALCIAACGRDDTGVDPPLTVSGSWSAVDAGALYDLHLSLTDQSGSISGQWSGYKDTCTPLNSPGCRVNGTVPGGTRSGSDVILGLSPSSPCQVLNATIAVTFTDANTLSGTFTQHFCNASDSPAAAITLKRQ